MKPRYLASALGATLTSLFLSVLAVSPTVFAVVLPKTPAPQFEGPVPSPELEPADVVRIPVEALRGDSLLDDGVVVSYRFASPANKRITGPLARFANMVHSPPYDRLLNHRVARYSPIAISGDEAHQIVIVTDTKGGETPYHWVLALQAEGEYKDCWMTDAVIPVERPKQHETLQSFSHTGARYDGLTNWESRHRRR